MERLAAIDEVFLTIDTPTTRQAVASYCLLDRIPDWELARTRICEFTTRFPRAALRATRQGHHHVWQPSGTLDASYHLPIIRLNSVQTREQFDQAVAEQFAQPLRDDAPLWQFSLFIADSTPFVGVLFKLHHAFSDGVGGLEMIDWWCSAERETPIEVRNRDRGPAQVNHPSVATPKFRLRDSAVLASLGNFIRKPSQFWYWIRSFCGLPKQGLLNDRNSTRRAIHTTQISHARIRQLKRRHAVSSNDLLLGIIAAGVGDYLNSHRDSTAALRIVVPVSLRKPSARWSLGNHLTAVPVALPLMRRNESPLTASDVLDQIRVTSSCMQELKRRGAFATYERLANAVAHLPFWLRKFTCQYQARRTHFICTNMPSSVRERYFSGAKILENYGLAALMQSHGMAIGLITYHGAVNIAVVSDPEIVKDPQSVITFIRQAIERIDA